MFRFLLVSLLSIVLAGCPGGVAPGSKPYTPADPQEQQLYSEARRNVFPNDVRVNPAEYVSTTLLWTGVIVEIERQESSSKPVTAITFEHHYWDFIEDYSVQKEIAFLSPRGEGKFRTVVDSGESGISIGEMAIAYVVPESVNPNGTVMVQLRGLNTLRRELYATDIWDYGRAYLLKGDMSDFKTLRVPGL